MDPMQLPYSSPESKTSFTELLNDLQRENMRLQRIVSELLAKNQLLRGDLMMHSGKTG